jgi:hypothetical protein
MGSFSGCDCEVFDAAGYHAVKGSKEIARDKKTITYECDDIKGDITYMEELLTAEQGKKVILVQREKDSSL